MAKRPPSRAEGKAKGATNKKPSERPVEDTRKAASKSGRMPSSTPKAPPSEASGPTAVGNATRAAKAAAPPVVQPKSDAAPSPMVGSKTKISKTARPAKASAPHATRAETPPAKASERPRQKTAPARKTRPAGKPRAVRKTNDAPPAYLAVELGQPCDQDGEPIGAGSPKLQSDEALQAYALKLWRQMQSGSVVNRYSRAIERAGLTVDEVWTAGAGEIRPTSSTADEVRRYRQKVLFRANLLEAILTETVADLRRLEDIEPAAPHESEPGEPAGDQAIEVKRRGVAHGRPRGI